MESVKIKKYPAYKDSGVEWLGEIPEHWEVRRIKHFFNEINERSVNGDEELLSVSQYTGVTKKSDKIDVGELLTTASTLEGYKKVYKGDLVSNIMLAWNGSLGFSPFDGITSPAYSTYRLLGENEKRYFHYLLRTELYKAEFKRNSSGVIESRLRLYTDDFFRIISLLPPLPEQAAIAKFLDRKTALIDQAIGIKEKQIELLKERRQILIHRAVTRGLNPDVKLKNSGVEWIGEIPEHWEVTRSKTLFTERKERARKNDVQLTSSQKFGVIPQHEYMAIEGRRVTQVEFNREIQKHVEKGDFMISMRSFQGGIEYSEYEGCISSAYVSLIPCDLIVPSYYKYLLKCDRYIEALQSTSNLVRDGQALRYDNFKQVDLLKIPKEEQTTIASFIEKNTIKIFIAISLKEKEIEKLKEYKASLINEVVTGKIKVC